MELTKQDFEHIKKAWEAERNPEHVAQPGETAGALFARMATDLYATQGLMVRLFRALLDEGLVETDLSSLCNSCWKYHPEGCACNFGPAKMDRKGAVILCGEYGRQEDAGC